MITERNVDGLLEMAADIGLTPTETFIVGTLLSEDRWWPLWEVAFVGPQQSGSHGSVKVHVCHIRKKFRAFDSARGAEPSDPILRKNGFGYRLPVETRQRLLNWDQRKAA